LNDFQTQCQDFVDFELDNTVLSQVIISKAENPAHYAYYKAFCADQGQYVVEITDESIIFYDNRKELKVIEA